MRFNPQKWLARLNKRLEAAIGRQLQVEGVEFVLLPRPRLTLEGLTLSNPDWSDRPHFLCIDRIVAEISLTQLIRRKLVFPKVWVYGGEFSYEYGPDGRDNWEFDGATTGSVEDSCPPDFTLPVMQDVFIEDLRFPVIDAAEDFHYLMRFDDAHIVMDDPKSVAAVRFNFEWGHLSEPPCRILVDGQMTSFHELFNGRAVAFDATMSGYDMVLKGAGQWHQTEINAKANLAGPSLDRLGPLFDATVMESKPFLIDAQLSGDLAHEIRFQDARLQFDDSRVHGDVTLDWQQTRLMISGQIDGGLVDIQDFGAETAPVPDTSRLVPDIDLDWTALAYTDWDLDIVLQSLQIGDFRMRNLSGNIAGADGLLTFQGLEASGYDGQWQGLAEMRVDDGDVRWAMKLEADSVLLADFLAAFDLNVPINGPTKAVADLTLRGRDLRAWADSLTGEFELSMDQAMAESRMVDFLGGDVVRTLLGSLQDVIDERRGTPINCAMMACHFDQGVGTSKLSLIDTRRMTMYIDGHVDFPEERLDLVLTPKAKEAGLSLGTPIHVFGPMHRPNVVVDPTALARKAAGLAVGVATIGAGLMLPLPREIMRNLAEDPVESGQDETAQERATRLDAARRRNRNAADVVESGIDDAVKTTIKGVDFALKTLLGPPRGGGGRR